MRVQIIVPAINLWEKYTKPCLESIQTAMVAAKKHDIDCRLLFIDNGSSDATITEAGKMVSDVFAHQRNEERWGFEKSVNFGVNDAWSRGFDYVLVCNNDILIHPQAIWRLVERLESGKPINVPVKKKMPAAYTDIIDTLPVETYESCDVGMATALDVRGECLPSNFMDMNPDDKAECPESPHPNFSAFMLSKQCWDEVGEFDEVFAPAYFEDNDYHYRMTLSNLAAICVPMALFYHYGSATQKEANENGQPMMTNDKFEGNRQKYIQKWGGLPGQELFTFPYDNEEISVSTTLSTG